MGVDDARDRDPAARELLDDHRVGRQVQAHPAVLLGDRHAEKPELLHLLDDRLREGVLVVVVLGVGQDLLVDELADHLGDRPLLVGLLGVRGGGYGHAVSAPWSVFRGLVEGEYRHELRPRRARARRRRASRWSSSRATARGASGASARSAERSARGSPVRSRARGVGRGDVVMTLIGNRPEWVLDDGRVHAHRRRRAAVHRAAAREGPAPADRRRAPVADRRRRAQPRASCDGCAAPDCDGRC